MAIELKHLFNPEIVPRRLLAFALPNATGYNETCGQIGCVRGLVEKGNPSQPPPGRAGERHR